MIAHSNFNDRYIERVAQTNSLLCVGLDPTWDHLPPEYYHSINDMEQYLRKVIEIAAKKVPVIKPQLAYFSSIQFGSNGVPLMIRLIQYAHSLGLLVILDGKKADIGETMEQYGHEVFGRYNADAATFVPYLGSTFLPSKSSPGWLPWLNLGRMVITMIRTSNAEAVQIQDLELKNGLRVYEQLAVYTKEWNQTVLELTDGAGSVGGVVGATWPEQAPRCRELAGDDVFILAPGYGAQGGGSDGAVSGLVNSRNELMGTVNSSRAITLTSWWDKEKKEPKEGKPLSHVRKAINDSNKDLNAALVRRYGMTIVDIIHASGLLAKGEEK